MKSSLWQRSDPISICFAPETGRLTYVKCLFTGWRGWGACWAMSCSRAGGCWGGLAVCPKLEPALTKLLMAIPPSSNGPSSLAQVQQRRLLPYSSRRGWLRQTAKVPIPPLGLPRTAQRRPLLSRTVHLQQLLPGLSKRNMRQLLRLARLQQSVLKQARSSRAGGQKRCLTAQLRHLAGICRCQRPSQ